MLHLYLSVAMRLYIYETKMFMRANPTNAEKTSEQESSRKDRAKSEPIIPNSRYSKRVDSLDGLKSEINYTDRLYNHKENPAIIHSSSGSLNNYEPTNSVDTLTQTYDFDSLESITSSYMDDSESEIDSFNNLICALINYICLNDKTVLTKSIDALSRFFAEVNITGDLYEYIIVHLNRNFDNLLNNVSSLRHQYGIRIKNFKEAVNKYIEDESNIIFKNKDYDFAKYGESDLNRIRITICIWIWIAEKLNMLDIAENFKQLQKTVIDFEEELSRDGFFYITTG